MHALLRALSIGWVCAVCALLPGGAAALTYGDIASFVAPTNAAKMIYSPAMNALVLKNSGSAIVAIDIASRQSTTRLANTSFTDISLAPSGRYVFAADYGGENIGPLGTSYVHRLDLTNMTWDLRTAYIAGDVQAVSDTQLILKSIDQWVTFTNNAWGSGNALVPLNTPTNSSVWGPGYYAVVYEGDFRYDVRTGRLLHGNSGSSSQEIQAFAIVNNEFVDQEGSGVYGSAQGYGTNVALATDGSAFYYGALQVDPLDVSHNVRVFPERIYAANGSIALGNGKYYDAHSGLLLGTLPFGTTVYALNPSGGDFWAFDPATTTVHHFAAFNGTPTSTTLSSSGNPAAAGSSVTFTATVAGTNPTGSVSFAADGGASLVGCGAVALTGSGNSKSAGCSSSSLGIGSHSIVASYSGDATNAASSSAPYWEVISTGAPALYTDIASFAASTNAAKMIYSPAMNALVLKNSGSAIVTIDIASRQSTTRLANTSFTDMSLAPSGRYVFAADYGGENIGYGTPSGTSYVHRLDLTNMTWDLRTAYIAGNVQAVSDTQLILKSIDQWVTFTNNAWGSGTALVPLNTPTGYWGPGYYAAVYDGDFRYDVRTGRLLHGDGGLSSQEIQAFAIINNEFVDQEGSGVYGSAQGYGANVVLATDGSAFYYGALQVDPLDVSHNVRVFPERIYAANGSIALGNGKYYDAHSGLLLGTLPFGTTVYAPNPFGGDFWAFDPATNTVHHFMASTNTTLSSSANPAPAGSSVTFTATVAGTNPTGSVSFAADGGAALAGCGAVALSGSGYSKSATCSTSSLAVGTHYIVASYSGDATNAASSSAPYSQVTLSTGGFTNGSFETPVLSANGYQYAPSGATWTFGGGAGIQRNGSVWGAVRAPDGVQTAFIQGASSISQTLSLSAGNYVLSFNAAMRSCCVSPFVQPIKVTLDGTQIGNLISPASTSFAPVSISFSLASSGAHTISFAGTDAEDKTTFIDAVTLGVLTAGTTLVSSLNPARVGKIVTFTATVTGTTPTGSVAFTSNGNPITGCTAVAIAGSGSVKTASCLTKFAAQGTYSIVARYSGDASNAASTSTPLPELIKRR